MEANAPATSVANMHRVRAHAVYPVAGPKRIVGFAVTCDGCGELHRTADASGLAMHAARDLADQHRTASWRGAL